MRKKTFLNFFLFAEKKRFLNFFLLIFLFFLLELLRLQQSGFQDKNLQLILAGEHNPPLCLQLSAQPTLGGAQLAVVFTGKGSIKDGRLTQARFVFGDNAEEIRKEDFGKFVEVTTSHVYKLPGTYTANFFLSDELGTEVGGAKTCQAAITVEGEILPAVKI